MRIHTPTIAVSFFNVLIKLVILIKLFSSDTNNSSKATFSPPPLLKITHVQPCLIYIPGCSKLFIVLCSIVLHQTLAYMHMYIVSFKAAVINHHNMHVTIDCVLLNFYDIQNVTYDVYVLIAGLCVAVPIVDISRVSSNQSEIKIECIVYKGSIISLASNETIGSITDGHRIQFGLFDSIGKSILKGDANVILTYVNRSHDQEIMIVEITMDISTSNFTTITLTCGSDHVNKSITVTVPSKYYYG